MPHGIKVTKKKKKEPKKTPPAIAGEGRSITRGGKGFIIPKREAEELERRGKETDKTRALEERREALRQAALDAEERRKAEELAKKERQEAVVEETISEDIQVEEPKPGDTEKFTETFTAEDGSLIGRDPKTGEQKLLAQAGTARPVTAEDIGTVAGGVGISFAVKGVLKAGYKRLFTKRTAAEIDEGVARIAEQFGLKESTVRKSIAKRDFNKEVSKLLTEPAGKKLLTKATIKAGGTIVVADAVIATWYALDNIISGTSILMRDTANDVIFGENPRKDVVRGREVFDEAQRNVDFAKSYVNSARIRNPLLWWPLGKLYKQGLEAQQFQIDQQRERMEAGANR